VFNLFLPNGDANYFVHILIWPMLINSFIYVVITD